jgi:hypothetical protein
MKLLILVFTTVFILISTLAFAAGPYLTCDPQEGVTKYKLIIDNGVEVVSNANADGSAWHDMSDTPTGIHDASFYAGAFWTIDDVQQLTINWSDPRPFVLGRPNVSQSPTNIGLSNN